MSEEHSARLGLPLLVAGQAQKEIDHNEALTLLDLAVQAAVVEIGPDVPPDAPEDGACWIAGVAPVGDWAGRAAHLAGWTGAGWRFLAPREGMAVWSIADGCTARYSSGAWTIGRLSCRRLRIDGLDVVGPQRPAIAAPSGGATIDAEARAVVASILDTLRVHGLIAS